MNPTDLEIIRCVGWDRLDEYRQVIKTAQMVERWFKEQEEK